ncbi:UNVERIFIED_CONTAM: hypothetical protein K2H54_056431 [Gekko kuhli]
MFGSGAMLENLSNKVHCGSWREQLCKTFSLISLLPIILTILPGSKIQRLKYMRLFSGKYTNREYGRGRFLEKHSVLYLLGRLCECNKFLESAVSFYKGQC